MSEYWKSMAKKYCEYCKVWITDNKPSIAIHESGKNHKEKVREKLQEISKKAEAKKAEDKVNQKTMAAIEQAARQAMEQDLESNPHMSKQYSGTSDKSNAQVPKSVAREDPKPKAQVKESKQIKAESEKPAQKRKLEHVQESKIGKWEIVKDEKIIVKTSANKPVDLQLPTKYDKRLPNEIAEKTEIEKEPVVEPTSKWKPLSETDTKDQSEPVCEKEPEQPKREAAQEPKQEIKEEITIPEDFSERRLNLKSGKKEKPVAFKKRKVAENVQLRERENE